MRLSIKTLIITGIVVFAFSGCKQNNKEQGDETLSTDSTTVVGQIDAEREIDVWKQDLIASKTLGKPCNMDKAGREDREKWTADNPGQLDGFPSDKDRVGIGKADFDNDGEQDVILFFNSENCTGHNGGAPSFAKIIYGDGHPQLNVQDDIHNAGLAAYKEKKKSNNDLLDVTDNDLRNTLSIGFVDNHIQGEFKLYTNDDAHCCPSYTGKYTYDPTGGQAEIEVTRTKK